MIQVLKGSFWLLCGEQALKEGLEADSQLDGLLKYIQEIIMVVWFRTVAVEVGRNGSI